MKSKKSKSSKTKRMNLPQNAHTAESLKKHYFNTGKAEGSGYITKDTYEFMNHIDDGELDDYKDFK